jgi:lipopolysaccharide assembly outer membrane protein LptD (OstA)
MDIEVDNTARMHNTIFEIKGISVIYFPYVVLPAIIRTPL